jgi:hypothetical protein
MKRIFISHAKADAPIAQRLASALRDAGHETVVDAEELTLGDDAIAFMNDGIAQAGAVIILHSANTPNANWQKLEINGALWNHVVQGGGECIVVRLDATPILPLLGPKVWGTLNVQDPSSFSRLLEDLCARLLPAKTASSIVTEAFRSQSANPFRRVRAEYFEDKPDLLASAFAPPDALKTGALTDMKPCFLEGSRGTGKSMLLLSLRARNLLSRRKAANPSGKIFGLYLKLSRGALCNAGIPACSDGDPKTVTEGDFVQMTDAASQEIILCLIESLFSELDFCLEQRLLPCDQSAQKILVELAVQTLFSRPQTTPRTLQELLISLSAYHRDIADFIRRKFIYGEAPTVPIATLDLDAFKRIVTLVKKTIPALADAMFMLLLDEYENLFPYQQRVVNSYVKLGAPEVSVKIAKKLGTGDISGTMTGQELQEIHDYTRLPLIYDIDDRTQQGAYTRLLTHITKNILSNEAIPFDTMASLLPDDRADEVDPDGLRTTVSKLCKMDVVQFSALPEAQQREKLTYYGEAATYRILYGAKGRHKRKRFSGFAELAFLSSGVIRYFQEILGVAYHLSEDQLAAPTRHPLVLSPSVQSEAVHFVSEHNLTTLSRNVEKDGEILKYFLLDLGDCLRQKLLLHTSEPEAARLTISDPELLDLSSFHILRRILDVGEREGVFQTKEGRPAFKPRHSSDPQPSEFNICRIYAPVLETSPRLRWRTEVTCADLLSLLNPAERARAKKKLMSTLARPRPESAQQELPRSTEKA